MNIEELRILYTDALYTISDLEINLVVGDRQLDFDIVLKDHHTKSACLITAANPYSQELTEEENITRNDELKLELDKKWKSVNAFSSDQKAQEWKEEGFCVFGISLIEALTLAGKYGQHAILFYEIDKEVELIFTGAEIKSNDSWKDDLQSLKFDE